MKEFPKDIRFKYNWRRYQKRVLDDLETYLDDRHLHIIAPPGSGKTVLGLEVAVRLNKPTLILAPTVAVRNQWIQRFCELFLQVSQQPDWISRDIKKPEFLTVVTYQSLHAACSKQEDEIVLEDQDEALEDSVNTKIQKKIDAKRIVKSLRAIGVRTIVVDEAHHMKNEWWKSLNAVKNDLKPTVVGLTATPPYDVSCAEWERYCELCGPVDAEISVPELVVENDLCPHQDYVYLSEPTENEAKLIAAQRAKALKVFGEIKQDEIITNALMSHPIYQFPMENLEWIYKNIECYSSVLIYLNAVGKAITKDHLEVIGDKKFKVPSLNYEWLEVLLTFFLFRDKENFNDFEDHKEYLINKLRRNGLLERKVISFKYNKNVSKFLNASLSKLQSIDNIVDVEHDTLGRDLRMVILTDFIRKEFLVNESVNNLKLNKIGVIPIFEQLRRTNDRNMKLGVLSGSLVIIPTSALDPLVAAARALNIEHIPHSRVPFDHHYFIIDINEKIKHDIVRLVTQIFEQGDIEVLIGTKSLLGEGWDAPSVNSLILASFVGSYVLSNQMRGRAIRSDRNNVNKTGNIWHLVCVDSSEEDGGNDIQLIKRRFRAFVGVSNGKDVSIENGINRLDLPTHFSKSKIELFNKDIIAKAGARDLLRQKWTEALKKGVSLTEEIKVPFPEDRPYKTLKTLYYKKTIGNACRALVFALLAYYNDILDSFRVAADSFDSSKDMYMWIMYVGVGGVLFYGGQTYKTCKLLFKYRDISKDIQKIGEALLLSLVKMGIIQTNYSNLQVLSSVDFFGTIYCHLEGGTTYENSIFIKSLQEIISQVENPRYLIVRKNLFLKVISQKDYHSVPELIGRNKKNAEYLKRKWNELVGACDLIYTRSIEGRKILLQSRIKSLSSQLEEKTERINKWR